MPIETAEAATGAPVRTLIDLFLEAQADTTAVQRFSRQHDPAFGDQPARARWYRDLLPATPPGPGQQYAFSVDLDACTGCKACVTACSSLNGLDDGETWRTVGLLIGTDTAGAAQPTREVGLAAAAQPTREVGLAAAAQPTREVGLPAAAQHVTTACHHCVDPGCLTGCPVDAYEKDPVTGVVVHLDDQCIGCRYCTLTCPYEVPQFDRSRGIVRKCDLCHGRLAAGEAPACVQGCPTNAISITIVDLEDVGSTGTEAWPFPAPDPATTRPTTRWTGSGDLATTVASDRHVPRRVEAHTPLAIMLVLTQVAVGVSLFDLVLGRRLPVAWGSGATGAVLSLVVAAVALAASVFHLGRPLLAWRAVIGLRHSWLSREIVAFSSFAGLAGIDSAVRLGWLAVPSSVAASLPAAALLAGICGVWSSVMIYAVTGRHWWRASWSTPRFGLTMLLGGAALATATVAVAVAGGNRDLAPSLRALAGVAVALVVAKLTVDLAVLAWRRRDDSELARSARLLTGPLADAMRLRVAMAVFGSALVLAALILAGRPETGAGAAAVVAAGALAVVGGELVERWLFFAASSPARMPGQR